MLFLEYDEYSSRYGKDVYTYRIIPTSKVSKVDSSPSSPSSPSIPIPLIMAPPLSGYNPPTMKSNVKAMFGMSNQPVYYDVEVTLGTKKWRIKRRWSEVRMGKGGR